MYLFPQQSFEEDTIIIMDTEAQRGWVLPEVAQLISGGVRIWIQAV